MLHSSTPLSSHPHTLTDAGPCGWYPRPCDDCGELCPPPSLAGPGHHVPRQEGVCDELSRVVPNPGGGGLGGALGEPPSSVSSVLTLTASVCSVSVHEPGRLRSVLTVL